MPDATGYANKVRMVSLLRDLILQGDVFEQIKNIPGNSVHCIVTSPPY